MGHDERSDWSEGSPLQLCPPKPLQASRRPPREHSEQPFLPTAPHEPPEAHHQKLRRTAGWAVVGYTTLNQRCTPIFGQYSGPNLY